jgi:hypothetical protein
MMSDLSYIEKNQLERQFAMGSGYVLDFTDRTFSEFVLESTRRNIYDSRYHYQSGSKANRLRAFWKEEPNHIAGKLINDLLDYCVANDEPASALLIECRQIAQRLLQGGAVEDIEAIAACGEGRDFEVLSRAVRDAIDKNEPEAGLDRLHTYVVKYIRDVCQKRGIETGREKPLHSLIGEYVKTLRAAGLIESEMTERILKSSIGAMEAFNLVRHEHSFAHDNPILNCDESLLIYNHVCSVIRFVRQLERRAVGVNRIGPESPSETDEVPF